MIRLRYYLLLLNNYKFFRILKWFLALIVFQWIKIQRYFIKNRKSLKKKKRLFVTTGNLSLINVLTIIRQTNEKNCEDYLIIESPQGGYNFWKNNYIIAQKHNFKRIALHMINCRRSTDLRLTGWAHFDEIYGINVVPFSSVIEMYPNTDINLFDEGCGALVNKGDNRINNNGNIKHFYTHKYINKIDYFGLPENITSKIVSLDTNIFRQVSKEVANLFPITTLFDKQDKNILYCGIWWKGSGLSHEKFIEVQNKQIQDLLQAGYKILFKPHPRETEFYGLDKNPNITFIETVMPVEIYDWEVLATTGTVCSSTIHIPHYHNIPAFSNVTNESIINTTDSLPTRIIRYFIKEYTPDYKELLKLDVKNTSREELKIQIKKIYNDFLKDKPLLSQNKNVEEFAITYGSN